MVDLSEDGLRIVETLVKAPVAWQSPAELALAMGRGLEATTDLLASMDAGGWLSPWDREVGMVVTLSVAAASRLGVRLVEVGQDEVLRWAGAGEPDPPGPKAVGVFRSSLAAALELVVDASATAEQALERAEAALSRSAIPSDPRERPFIEGLPSPTLLLGIGLSPWPGPGDARKASCPSCGSRRLEPSMYCLYCDRWGLDHLLIRDEPASLAGADRRPPDDPARREHERRSRKARRGARQAEQVEAERRSKRRPRRPQP